MRAAKLIVLSFIPIFCLNIFTTEIAAQKRKIRPARKISKTKKQKSAVVSAGVLMGKVIALTQPKYPATARSMQVQGTVTLQILIDETGKVIDAKVTRGHPLLRASSLKAAKTSFFEAFTLSSGQKVKAGGVIFHNYTSNSMNWLELGFYGDSFEKLKEYLPLEEERDFLTQSENLPFDEKAKVLETVSASIENRLLSDSKNLWLFTVGKNLRLISNGHWNPETKKQALDRLKNQLYSKPDGISPRLTEYLARLTEAEHFKEFQKTLIILTENSYRWGN